MKFLKQILAATAFMGAASMSMAADSLPGIMGKVTDGKDVQVLKVFDVPGNLKGYAVTSKGMPSVFFTDKKGEVAFFGVLIDKNGKNLTKEYLEKYAQPKAFQHGISALEEDAAWFEEGTGQQVVYVFYEPNCGYCHRLYKLLRNHLTDLRIRWVPMAFLSNESAPVAAYMLASDNPNEYLAKVNEAKEKNQPLPEPGPYAKDHLDKLELNSTVMRQFGIQGTPAVVYEKDGKTSLIKGVPSMENLADMIGTEITMKKASPSASK